MSEHPTDLPPPQFARPCRCDRVRRGEPFDETRDCRPCWLFHHDRRYKALFSGTATVSAVAAAAGSNSVATPCVFRGEELTFVERDALQVRHDRRWALCLNPDHTAYQRPVCPCTGCGTKCPSYVPSQLEDGGD